ncbi:MAG TPA: YtxH domain-containing protein [Bacteroidales bacterium]|nr:YtxH domain-containing protein [Bacteroidales bacterium]
MSTGKLVAGVLAGVAVGAAVGVLFAPDKGTNTRRRISKKGEDLIEGVRDKLNQYLDSIKKQIEVIEEEAENLYSAGTSEAEELKREFENTPY